MFITPLYKDTLPSFTIMTSVIPDGNQYENNIFIRRQARSLHMHHGHRLFRYWQQHSAPRLETS